MWMTRVARSLRRGVVGLAVLASLLGPSAISVFGQETDSSPQAEAPSAPPPSAGKVAVDRTSASVTGALQGQEGVRIQTMCTHCNSANIQLGGLSQDLVPISFAGYPLFGGLATTFVMNMLLPDSVAEAQITRGPGEAEAPCSAAGGEIELEAADPGELPWGDLLIDRGSFDRWTVDLRAAGPLTSWLAGSVTAGYETVDRVDADGDGQTDVAAVDRRIADARALLTPSRSHRIDLGYSLIKEDDTDGRGAVDEIGVEPDGDITATWFREDDEIRRDEYRAGWEWRLRSAGTLALRGLVATRDQSIVTQDRIFTGLTPFYEKYRIDENNHWVSLRYSQPIGHNWRVIGGVESVTESVTAREQGSDGGLSQDSLDETETLSGFLSADYTPSAHWDLLAGIRYDRVDLSGRTTRPNRKPETTVGDVSLSRVSPRVTINYRPAEAWTIRLIGGGTVRAPRPILSEVCCGRAYISNAEVGVRPETAWTLAVETLYQPSPEFKTSLYVARVEFDDFVQQLVADSFFFRQAYANANIPSVQADTAEVVVRWSPIEVLRLDGSIGWLSMFNEGERDVSVKYVPLPSGVFPTTGTVAIDRIPYRPVRSGSLGATLTLPHGVVVGAQSSYTGPQLIQQWLLTLDREEMREVAGFWLTSVFVTAPLGRHVELTAGIDNVGDFVQTDLGDPTRDYNWGPLTGRSYRFGVRLRLPR